MKYILSILVTAVLFVVLILLLAAKPKLSKKITVWALAIAGIFGLLVYGYGYMMVTDNLALAALKALLAVCGSFVGANEYDDLASVPVMQTPWMQILCTFIRICALYATASTVITAISAETLKRLRLWMARRSRLNLIYGVSSDTLDFGKELLQIKQGAVVYVANQPSASAAAAISAAGCVLRTDPHALDANGKFLRSIGFGRQNRDITVYALDPNTSENIRYARKLLASLEMQKADPRQLRLVILAQEELAVRSLQAAPGSYGYGFVTVVNGPQMAARLLTLKYPPCDTISFDENGRACQDFEALVIGFGQVGQAVLKALVMNGQFEGSHFRAAVFASDCHNADGSFAHQFRQLYQQYDIAFFDQDARSQQLYAYLNSRGGKLKYVAVCTGNEKLNREIVEDLTTYFQNAQLPVPVYQCSRSGVETYGPDGTLITHKIYCTDVLCTNTLDAMAMILNHRYQPVSEKTALENWMDCDYFSRQSCRASADFVSALLRAAGKTPAQATSGDWQLSDAQLENLSRTEHLRWCAFHYCMGFAAMSDEEFQDRSQTYQQQVARDGHASIRIGKNMSGRTHACLIPWEALDDLAEKEAAVTGKRTDYKQMDADNVLAVPQLLQTDLDS